MYRQWPPECQTTFVAALLALKNVAVAHVYQMIWADCIVRKALEKALNRLSRMRARPRLSPISLSTSRRAPRSAATNGFPTGALSKRGYDHHTVNHSKDEWVRGDVHTNGIENLWAQLKRSIKGTHIHVSKKHLDKYLVEFECRFNIRHSPQEMFDRLLMAF